MKRPLFWTGAAFLSSLAVFLRLKPVYAAALAAAFSLFAAFLSSSRLKLRRILLLLSASVLGAVAALGYSAAKSAYLSPVISAEYADIVMVCNDFDSAVGHRSISGKALITSGEETRTADITVWGYFEEPPMPGETIALTGKRSEPLVYSVNELSAPPEQAPFKLTAFRLKMQSLLSQRIFCLSFDDECGAVLTALLTGDRSHIPSSITGAFRKSSLSHLLAISGMHIVLMSAAVQGIFRPLLKEKGSSILAAAVCWAFACLAGLGVSVIRACIMMTVLNIGCCFARKSDTLTSLMLAAMLITLFSPEAIFSASFLLSFSAVLGLAVLAPKPNGNGGAFNMLKSGIGVSAAAQIGTLPACALLFKTVSVVGILANLAAVWLLQPIMLLGLAGVLLGFILPFAASLLLIPSLLMIRLLILIAKLFSSLFYSSESFGEYWQLAWLILAAVLALTVFCRAPEGFCRRLAISLLAAVYLTVAVFSALLGQGSIYALTFDDSGCCAVISGGHALLFGSADESWQYRAIENALSQAGVQRLDGIIAQEHDPVDASAFSLMESFGCKTIYAESSRYYSQLCRSAGLTLCEIPSDGIFFGRIKYIPAEDGFELLFDGGKILKTDGKCDIIGRYHPMPPVEGAVYIRAENQTRCFLCG